MSQLRTVLRSLKTPNSSKSLGLLNGTPMPFHHKNEEEGRERVSLLEASRRIEDNRGRAIYKNGKSGGGHQCHDPSNPVVIEPKGREDFLDVIPIHLVIRFGYIQLHHHPHLSFVG